MIARSSATPRTRISFDMEKLAIKLEAQGRQGEALQVRKAGAAVDVAAFSLGYKGPRVKQMVCYSNATQLYRHVTGQPYEG